MELTLTAEWERTRSPREWEPDEVIEIASCTAKIKARGDGFHWLVEARGYLNKRAEGVEQDICDAKDAAEEAIRKHENGASV